MMLFALAAAAATVPAVDTTPRQLGATVIEVSITATGKVDSCRAVVSSGDAALDAKACALIVEQATYQPSVDKAGKPVASVERISLAWAGN